MYTLQDVGPYKNVNGIAILMDDAERQALLSEWNLNLATRVPQGVTMRQARLALLQAGKLSAVNTAIAAMQGAAGEAARIEWDYSNEVLRNQPLTIALAQAIGMTETEMDALFVQASTL